VASRLQRRVRFAGQGFDSNFQHTRRYGIALLLDHQTGIFALTVLYLFLNLTSLEKIIIPLSQIMGDAILSYLLTKRFVQDANIQETHCLKRQG